LAPENRVEIPSGFTVSLPLTIRPAFIAKAVPLDVISGYRAQAVASFFPWLSLTIAGVLLAAAYQAALRLKSPLFDWAWGPILLLGLVLSLLEMGRRVDRLTAEGIERRAGILGRRVHLIPYSTIELVDVRFPLLGRAADTGDLRVRADGRDHWFLAIKHPEEIEAAVEHLRRVGR
jgi:membrane protein YdbS with pleckstrin-like domain